MGREYGQPSPDREVDLFLRFSISEGLIDNFTEKYSEANPPPPDYIVDWTALMNGALNITRIITADHIEHLLLNGPRIRFSVDRSGKRTVLLNTILAVEKAESFMEKLAPIKPAPEDQ